MSSSDLHGSFNPRARVGRDLIEAGRPAGKGVFQSTRPRGARPDYQSLYNMVNFVSIHAPAWGATWPATRSCPVSSSFNPRARVGRDESSMIKSLEEGVFQSTRPRGARLSEHRCCERLSAFQSTRPRGARRGWQRPLTTPGSFQSTRPRGARQAFRLEIERDRDVSIHAPAWGATRRYGPLLRNTTVSIHAPAWGATSRRATGA